MLNTSEAITTLSVILVALGFLVWGYNRAKKYKTLGILAWLQSVVLITPWLFVFGLFAVGIYINFVGILALLIASSGIYIYLGNRLRAEGQAELLRQRAAQRLAQDRVNSLDATTASAETTRNIAIAPESDETDTIPKIPSEDLQKIKEIFGIDTFFATETISYQEGAIFKGNLRGETESTYEKLSNKLRDRFNDKYRLFLVENPEGKPIVIILPSSSDPQSMTLAQKNLAAVLVLATIATCTEAAGLLMGFDWFSELGRFSEALPIAAGVWFVVAVHEVGHRFWAKRHNVHLSFPFLLPSWQIGTFGSITRFESFLPNRSILFDVSFAGPAAGGIVSILMVVLGLLLSHPGSLFTLPTEFFQGSILVGTLAKAILGSQLTEVTVDIHPLTMVGWIGLVITALNLMPAGQLDGGRIVQAIYGRKTARRTTIATLIVLGLVAIVNPGNPIPLYWGIVILFLQRDLERPSLNELTEPDDARAALGLLVLFLMLATLIPLSPALAGQLGIG
ncbi:MAG: site-2 protease family protein [Spirulina sp. SIO3F2]|nr:site-2 protease family protein [Spirulina sp. SIO3F2]